MARLNPKRRRAQKLREALTELGKANNPSMVAQTGDMRSSAKRILPSQTRAPFAPQAGSFQGSAPRPTFKRWGLK